MRIPRALVEEVVEHAVADAPLECCGLIACREGEAVEVHRATNAARSQTRYEVEGHEQFRILDDIAGRGLQLGAIYHSHTRSRPFPSTVDIQTAFYPDVLYLIVGVADGEPTRFEDGSPEVRAFTIRDGHVAAVGLDVS